MAESKFAAAFQTLTIVKHMHAAGSGSAARWISDNTDLLLEALEAAEQLDRLREEIAILKVEAQIHVDDLHKHAAELDKVKAELADVKEELVKMKRAGSAVPPSLLTLAHTDDPRDAELGHSTAQRYEREYTTERDSYWAARFKANLNTIEIIDAENATLREALATSTKQLKVAREEVETMRERLLVIEAGLERLRDFDVVNYTRHYRGEMTQAIEAIRATRQPALAEIDKREIT